MDQDKKLLECSASTWNLPVMILEFAPLFYLLIWVVYANTLFVAVLLSLGEPYDTSLFDAFTLFLRGDDEHDTAARLSTSNLSFKWMEKLWTNIGLGIQRPRPNTNIDGLVVTEQYIALGIWLLNISKSLLNPEVSVLF